MIANDNSESLIRDIPPKGLPIPINILTRPRINENTDGQQSKVQFAANPNFFKNVSENKDIGKLISQLATCINITKNV